MDCVSDIEYPPSDCVSDIEYPPRYPEELLSRLITEVKDWQTTHGSLLKLVGTENKHTVSSRPIGVSLFPTFFPKEYFGEASNVQTLYNKLYVAISEDPQWLFDVLQDLIQGDHLANALWKIHTQVEHEGVVQDLTLGIFRSDYMLDRSWERGLEIRQVEFNTFSCAGGTHEHTDLQEAGVVVQPHNINICDERPIEYGLREANPPVPTYRVCFGEEVLASTWLTPSKHLLYHPQGKNFPPSEVSVIYMRAGYDAKEYDDYGYQSRLQLERLQAIKCPSVLCHLATFNKVQQALAMPNALFRFLPAREAARVAKTFAPLYPLDSSELGLQARKLACDPAAAKYFVMKPSLEGGGHNVYRSDIPRALERIPRESWHRYILMRLMNPPLLPNVLISPDEVYQGTVLAELGIFGACLWRRSSSVGTRESKKLRNKPELIMNRNAGWSFITKKQDVEEMSLGKGYACFDSPLLEAFPYS
ncbi:hypothetical protein LTR66_006739 [Elasticomyces elasticus]|nr:hypothetical protein LTR66_006739 [Elasticomyces elasticus]KAK4991345.1 hypothetical protein LTR50_001930 [Elasticomyces elasticus]